MRKQPTKPQSPTQTERKGKVRSEQTRMPTPTVTGKKVGRPTIYSQALAAHIAAQLANGRSLVQVLAEPDMPTKQTVYSWLHRNQEFLDCYVRAREEQADYFADACIEIADASVGMDSAGVAAARIRIEARKWRASVLKPRVYGTKIVAEKTLRVSQPNEEERIAQGRERFAQLRERMKNFMQRTE